jgi:hypothetical protein
MQVMRHVFVVLQYYQQDWLEKILDEIRCKFTTVFET